MKITFEPSGSQETEVVIKGDMASPEVASLLQFLGKKNSGKLILFKEDEQFVVDTAEIVFAETSANKINIYTDNDVYESKQKLYELMETLEAFNFVQINKSTLVNIDCVKSIQAEFSGNYCIKLKNRKEVLTVSRSYFKKFKESI